ncbi:hypothetical protein GGR22_000738 [Flavobacterium gossypii]|uniref:Protein NO VEIN C-terminal domain-containing protein n=1 Tax=Flavobacterium gossypii TaxID=1646119 RepID=A0ABR6DLR3_9FLAO|nr:DUF3883 domain-containing protein [Flavobacterium gossypii]MBA9072612.1 hypothetical protein [Flavobacterium gossypii]
MIDFFTQDELDFFKIWQLQAYDPKNKKHVDAKNHLMDSVWKKSIYLGKEVIKRLDGFSIEGKKIWHQRGWKENNEGVNVKGAIFKPYTWVKIFRNNDKGKDIFFTFGIDAYPTIEAFVYKIDCQDKRDSKLSKSQIELCKSLIKKRAKWNEITFENLIRSDWETLINACVEFINDHIEHYDAIVNSVWGEPIPPAFFKNQLIKRGKPINGCESIPETERKFNGVEIDFQSKAKIQKDLGNAGEALVKQREIDFLKEKGLHEKASLVDIVKDGKGYDVFSFDENGVEKFIEVKTTAGNEYSPFYLSENEIDFMRLHSNQYSIYRIYNYNAENNFGEFFELNGNVENQLLMAPTQYRVLIKKT